MLNLIKNSSGTLNPTRLKIYEPSSSRQAVGQFASNGANFAFWGTDEFAVLILESLKEATVKPRLIITSPDQPRGRHLILTAPPVKIWAEKNNLPVIQPAKLTRAEIEEKYPELIKQNYEFFLVASYGKIIPEYIINRPKHQTLNVHPSLLPKYRGPTPIQSAILAGETKTGVTLIKVDQKMDHGPIIAARSISLASDIFYTPLRNRLARLGAEVFLEIIDNWLAGTIVPTEQNHKQASYVKKISKEDGLISLTDPPEILDRKFRALTPWPGLYFFVNKNGKETRVKITDATFKDGQFVIKKIIPENKKEMAWEDFKRNL